MRDLKLVHPRGGVIIIKMPMSPAVSGQALAALGKLGWDLPRERDPLLAAQESLLRTVEGFASVGLSVYGRGLSMSVFGDPPANWQPPASWEGFPVDSHWIGEVSALQKRVR